MKRKFAVLLAAAAVTAALSACAAQQNGTAAIGAAQTAPAASSAEGSAASGITTEGEGKVSVVPDIAELSLDITTEGEDAEKAREENARRYEQAVEFLRAQGISETSIQTENVYLSPNYDWSSSEQRIIGYTMETSLRVSDIPVSEVGALLDQAVSAGINGIQSVSYLSSEYDATYDEALKLAVQNAQQKAEAIAEAGGVSAGRLSGVTEHAPNTDMRYTKSALGAGSMETEAMSADSAMSVMPGELEIKAHVTASFAIQ